MSNIIQANKETIPVENLMGLVNRLSREAGLSSETRELLESQISGLQDIYGRDIQASVALNIISQQIEVTKTGLIRKPVGLVEFIESPEYMNQGAYVRPAIMENLYNLFCGDDQYYEVCLGGAIGIGKNYFADMAVSYILYKMSCLYSPQAFYGLAPGSDIVFVHQSKTLLLARKVVFNQFAARLEASGYFPKYFPFSGGFKAQLKFPNNIQIIPVSSSDTAALGMNVFCFPAEQKYLLADGSLQRVGDIGKSSQKTVTLDELNFILPSDYDGAVYSGESELVRLHFDNGDTIDCTPDHLFRGECSEQIMASEAEGRLLDFVDLQTMWREGHLSNSALGEFAPDVRNGLQENISERETLWCEAAKDSAGQEGEERVCSLSGMRKEVPCHKGEASCIPQYDFGRVPTEISQRPDCNGGSGENKIGEGSPKCTQTTSKFKIQEVITGGDRKSRLSRSSLYEEKDGGSDSKKGSQRIRQEAVERIPDRDASETNRCRSIRKRGSQRVPGSLVLSLQGKRRNLNYNVFQVGDSGCILDGQIGYPMDLRTGTDNLPLQREEPQVYSGLQNYRRISRGKGVRHSEDGQVVEVKEGVYSKPNDIYPEDSDAGWGRGSIQLDGSEQNTSDLISRTPCKVQRLRCVRVERLEGKVSVYDVTNVKETHYFFAKTQSGFLVAHNCAVIDELNFMGRTRRSSHSQFTGETEYDQAEKLYTSIYRRLESRYMQFGQILGKIFLISSANYKGDFIDRKEEEAKKQIEETGKTHIYMMHLSQWEALPPDKFCGKKFWILLPEDKFKGAVCENKPAVDSGGVLEVPIEYLDSFNKDLLGSIRDLAGIPIARRNRIIELSYVETAFSYYEKVFGTVQIFPEPETVFEDIDILESLINIEFTRSLSKRGPFGAHIDLALTGDSAGIAIGHIAGSKDIGSRTVFDPQKGRFDTKTYGDLPVYAIVGLLKVMPPAGGEIDLNTIRDLLFLIADYIPLQWITFDTFQSASLIQSFRSRGVASYTLSVDKSPAAYLETKFAMAEQRVMIPRHANFEDEIDGLEQDSISGKIDHVIGGAKDVADAVAGVIFEFSKKKMSYRKKGDPENPTNVRRTPAPIDHIVRPSVTQRPSTGREELY